VLSSKREIRLPLQQVLPESVIFNPAMKYNLSVVNHQIEITILKNYPVFSITLQNECY
jgi:hypothetical protein